jgi:rubrerythrin
MKTKKYIGLGLVIAILLSAGILALLSATEAQAYYGPGGHGGNWTQSGNSPGNSQTFLATGDFGMGQMRGRGGPGNGLGPGAGIYTTTLSDQSIKAVTEALEEEYRAQATYQAIVNKFGAELPFVNILRSEAQHVTALSRQFAIHSLAVPADNWAGKVQAPATLHEAFTAAIQFEKDDAALYDRLLKEVSEPELTRVFTQLQNASLNMHLKALEYYNK